MNYFSNNAYSFQKVTEVFQSQDLYCEFICSSFKFHSFAVLMNKVYALCCMLFPGLFTLSLILAACNASVVLSLFWHSTLSSSKNIVSRGSFSVSFTELLIIWNLTIKNIFQAYNASLYPIIHLGNLDSGDFLRLLPI